MLKMDTVKLTILRGTLEEDNPLSLLRGNEHIWSKVFGLVDTWYEEHIDRKSVAFDLLEVLDSEERPRTFRSVLVSFPEPQGIHINMMPIKLFELDETVPANCQQYVDCIEICADETRPRKFNRVAYLTIHESVVPVGEAQRRPGLHIEQPGGIRDGGSAQPLEFGEYYWGRGWKEAGCNEFFEGIYMASNVSDSCTVWPVLINNPTEVSDRHGSIEHMRERLGPGRNLAAGELCWFTDRTPHEANPLKAPSDDPGAKFRARSFFRLVVGQISVWYSKHNTPNPLGVLPDAPISDEDKFSVCRQSKITSEIL
ncbi:hypothetical protein KFL_000690410 [Klebsormidium nitens]|uniref:Uncharacterized protein n=1 Tax=Klebsormidium nitens TaxID=105231 RepID=A0A1Y1HSH1_KLENI|nr:hypothetical protein KFL_000690410 [Klebsormidium nitens]|eukprot:GAQ81063.1 hypothetical protein KFL_000690410 [Klebsormidium nitens]